MERSTHDSPAAPSGGVRSRVPPAIFAAAVVIYALVALWVTRGASFTYDELTWITDVDGFHPHYLLEPHNGHLILPTRIIYAACTELFGLDHLAVRIAMVVAVAAAATVAFAMLRRRIGDAAALPIGVLILFFGTSTVPVDANVAVFAQSTAAGIGALLLLERPSTGRDLAAFALLCLSVCSFSLGIAFLLGAACLVLSRPSRWRRCWLVVLPAVGYAAWLIWAQRFGQEGIALHGLLESPSAAVRSLAAATGAFAGVGHLSGGTAADLVDVGWGAALAVLAAVVLADQARRGRLRASPMALALVVTLLAFLISINLSDAQFRPPESSRYLYPVAILLVLLVAELYRGARPSGRTLLVVYGAVALALVGNLGDVTGRGDEIRADSTRITAQLAMIELEANEVDPGFYGVYLPVYVSRFLTTVRRYGTFADTPAELAELDPTTGAQADAILANILTPSVSASTLESRADCRSVPVEGGAVEVPLPPGGATLRVPDQATLALRRFGAEPTVPAGVLESGAPGRLAIATDPSPVPWTLAITTTAASASICPLGPPPA